MRLYHFSEDPDIARFDPHVPAAQPAAPPLVWAIDEEHAPHYLFPRDCPRVCFWVGPGTTPADRERFFAHTRARKVIAVETSWLERVRGATLYEYENAAGDVRGAGRVGRLLRFDRGRFSDKGRAGGRSADAARRLRHRAPHHPLAMASPRCPRPIHRAILHDSNAQCDAQAVRT